MPVELARRRMLQAAAVAAVARASPLRAQAAAAGSGRTALVFGNSRYPGAPLKNAGNDARLMQQVLGTLGFAVTPVFDADLQGMLDALQAWLQAGEAAATRLFYYAGHGAQYRGRNYLIPIDAELRSEDDLPGRALDVNDLIARLARLAQGANVVVLDACRSTPMLQPPPGVRQRSRSPQPLQPGLAAVQAPRGTLVAYATAPGALAADDPAHDHSPYTRHLAEHLRTPGLPVEMVFKRTRSAVLRETGGRQVPWESSSLTGELCLAGAAEICGLPARR
ncbi:caspase family protein [Pseudorhodoferax sp.]|uniref:caspase family protein n=1 Tax=Pseudorhodoferax sp. TaxID=1993553 RepID=UPI002DD678FC|nr:caspase family protein [Pseudorhodoferax sp.]